MFVCVKIEPTVIFRTDYSYIERGLNYEQGSINKRRNSIKSSLKV